MLPGRHPWRSTLGRPRRRSRERASSARASEPSSLLAEVDLTVGRFHLGLTVAVNPGEVVAVLGPNGSGKSTLLRALAGLVPLDEGRIELDGQVLDDPAADIFVPPEERPVGVVFQSYLLFPHLSALDNVAFGLRRRGVPRRVARRAGARVARPGRSGRQGGRPAGRAVRWPGPACGARSRRRHRAGDAAARRAAVGARRADAGRRPAGPGGPTSTAMPGVRLLVTHDPLDALALADRIVIIEDGRVTQTGLPSEVTARPRTPYVAELVGTNLYRGRAEGADVDLATGLRIVSSADLDGPVFVVSRRPPSPCTEPDPTARPATSTRPRSITSSRCGTGRGPRRGSATRRWPRT